MSKRLLHLIGNLQHEGSGRQLPVLLAGLQNQGFDLHVCSLSQSGPLKDELAERKIPVTMIDRRWSHDPLTLRHLRRHLRQLAPEVIHTWDPLTHFFARYATLGSGLRNIISNCEIISAKPLQVFQPTDRRQALKDIGLPPTARLSVAVNEGLSYQALKQLIWTMCMLDYLRGDVHLLVFGKSKRHSQIERYCQLTQTSRRVIFFDNSQDLPRYLQHADCFVTNCDQTGQAGAILEAMAAGVPVIATDIPAHRELITHHQNGILVPVGDRGEMARWTNVLLNEKKLVSHLSNSAKLFAEKNYSVDQMVNRCAHLYREAA